MRYWHYGDDKWLVLTLLKLARLDASAVELKRESVPLSALTKRAQISTQLPRIAK